MVLNLHENDTIEAQRATENECQPFFVDLQALPPDQIEHLRQTGLLPPSGGLDIQLLRQKHFDYLSQVWKRSLKAPFISLDSSRPWILYWCLHGCDLLDMIPEDDERCRMVAFLESCFTRYTTGQHPVSKDEDYVYFADVEDPSDSELLEAGGFGGGPDQMPHAATTYAAILSLSILVSAGGEAADQAQDLLSRIRIPLYRWMAGLLDPESGAYTMHEDGEADIRASYTIMCCASLLKLQTAYLCQESVVKFIAKCQTFEGGLGGEPWSEAHGGYAYCGVAALQILNRIHALDVNALSSWLARRQMSLEGGFAGRTNKLADGCYSFWQGAAVAISSRMYKSPTEESEDPWMNDEEPNPVSPPLQMNSNLLERYILLCAQDVNGGLRDKPSKGRDFYHTCYNLSGLSISQNWSGFHSGFGDSQQAKVARTHPCYNIRLERVKYMKNMSW